MKLELEAKMDSRVVVGTASLVLDNLEKLVKDLGRAIDRMYEMGGHDLTVNVSTSYDRLHATLTGVAD